MEDTKCARRSEKIVIPTTEVNLRELLEIDKSVEILESSMTITAIIVTSMGKERVSHPFGKITLCPYYGQFDRVLLYPISFITAERKIDDTLVGYMKNGGEILRVSLLDTKDIVKGFELEVELLVPKE